MRGLNRNKRTLWYALRTGDNVNLDEYGNETGEATPQYGMPAMLECNISAATGQEAMEAFGSFSGYSRTMYVADNTCPIGEDSILWFGIEPTMSHNYIVVRKAESKNGILYAIQEVTVT